MECISLEFGLKINRAKTKMMILDRINNNTPEVTQIANCDVVQSYIYLGAQISNNGGCILDRLWTSCKGYGGIVI
ncbi:jg5028 [Pararge aegeria aegeria]|uniref:Jg5028 protein n=1 Tax=Pararge aegeria aegeria TaxID=348720 RepID=A0A8S4RG33_9NEOP|nr:jg5028 [Pararge aegeria aegeria]